MYWAGRHSQKENVVPAILANTTASLVSLDRSAWTNVGSISPRDK